MNLKYIQFEDNRKIFYFFNIETFELIQIRSEEHIRIPGYAKNHIQDVIDFLNKNLLLNFTISFENLSILDISKILEKNQIKIIEIKDSEIIFNTKYSVLDGFEVKKFLLQLYFDTTINQISKDIKN
jgi:hypothetical protein